MIKIALLDILDERNRDDRENIGLAIIGAYLRKHGKSVDFYSFTIEAQESFLNQPQIPHYDIYGFSIYPNTAEEVFRYARAIKDQYPESLIHVGGKLATVAAAEILHDCPMIDFIVSGYGEIPLLEVVQKVEQGKSIDGIVSIVTRQSQNTGINLQDVQDICWPARDFLPLSIKENNFTARVNTSNGCYGSCTFCSVNTYKDNNAGRWTGRNMEDVFKEMINIYETYNIKSFYFNDASFEDLHGQEEHNRIRHLCELLLGYQTKFALRCSMRAEFFMMHNMELIELMKETGFTQIFLGIESGDLNDLNIYNKRAELNHNHQSLQLMAETGIDAMMGFIMFNPYSTLDSIKNNYRFLVQYDAYRVDLFTGKTDVYYNTRLHRTLQKDNLLTSHYTYYTPQEYIFLEESVQKVDNFIERIRADQLISKINGDLYSGTCTINNLRALYEGDNPHNVYEELKLYRKAIAGIITEYFGLIYEENDLVRAEREFASFKLALQEAHSKFKAFMLKVMLNKDFRKYFYFSPQGKKK